MSRYIELEKASEYVSRLLGVMPVVVLKVFEKNSIDIVRCRKCKKSKEYRKSNGGFYRWCHENIREVKDDDFCSYGERESDCR